MLMERSLIAGLITEDDFTEWAERAAIIEFDAGTAREKAERMAVE